MNIFESDILKMKFPQPSPMGGDVLIAEPLMADNPFQRAVVAVVEHSDATGTMGLVMNRLSNYDLKDLVEDIDCDEDIPVYVGGPVHKERLYYVHTLGDEIKESMVVRDGLWISGDYDELKSYINSGGQLIGRIRFFLGYSGWEAGQLRRELDNFDWAVGDGVDLTQLLLLDEEDSWQYAVSCLDERYRLWRNCPRNVIMN